MVSSNRIGLIFAGLTGVAIVGSAVALHVLAGQRWDTVADRNPWVQTAEPRIAWSDWLLFQQRTDDQIIEITAPLAAAALDEKTVDIASATAMEDAQRIVGESNDLATACLHVPADASLALCEDSAQQARFERFESAFDAVPFLKADWFVERDRGTISLAQLQLYQARLCNYDPSVVTAQFTPEYSIREKRTGQAATVEFQPGECKVAFAEKLRAAPRLQVSASGDNAASAAFASMSRYQAVWRGRATRWNETIAFTPEAASVRRSFTNPALCHTRGDLTCGGSAISDQAAYTKALYTSLKTQQQMAGDAPGSIYGFHIGVAAIDPDSRDQFGPVVREVIPGTPAAVAGLQTGDRILSLDEKPIFTRADLIAAINQSGAMHGIARPLKLELERDGRVLTGAIAVAYNKAFFDAQGYDDAWAAWAGFLDNFTFGFGADVHCRLIRPVGLWLELKSVDPRIDAEECKKRWNRDREALKQLYSTGWSTGGFIGTILSPVTYVASQLISPSLFGTSRFAMAARQAALSTGLDYMRETRMAPVGQSAGQTLAKTLADAPLQIASDALFTSRR